MKIQLFLLSLLFSGTFCWADIIEVPAQGDYAKIDTSQQIRLIETLQNPRIKNSKKRGLAQEIFKNPGNHGPFVLLNAGIFYMQQQEFEKAALLYVGGLCRCEIDVRISKDNSLGDTPVIMMMRMGDAVEESLKSEKKQKCFQDAVNLAKKNFEVWDRKTPRNYDDCWIRLHSIRAFSDSEFSEIAEVEKREIIESFYLELKGIQKICAEPTDELFFDPDSRIFTYTESGLSFVLPEGVVPTLNRYGKYTRQLRFPNGDDLWLNDGWSCDLKDFEWDYQFALESDQKRRVLTRCTVGEGIPAYHVRQIPSKKKPSQVMHSFHFVHDHFSFNFDVYCDSKDEEANLVLLNKMIHSIKISDTGNF